MHESRVLERSKCKINNDDDDAAAANKNDSNELDDMFEKLKIKMTSVK